MDKHITARMLVLMTALLLPSAAARPLDSSGWPQEGLAALEASCDGCFDPMAAVEVNSTRSRMTCRR